jgi:hypothetical protein
VAGAVDSPAGLAENAIDPPETLHHVRNDPFAHVVQPPIYTGDGVEGA